MTARASTVRVVAATSPKNSARRAATGRPVRALAVTIERSRIPPPGVFSRAPGYSQGVGLKSNQDQLVASETAQALWYAAPGRAEIRPEALAAPGPREVHLPPLHAPPPPRTDRLIFSRPR